MRTPSYWCFVILAAGIGVAGATSIKDVALADLYRESEIVAVVRVTDGDTSSFEGTVYRAEVLEGFKGVAKGDSIHYGPFVSYGIGSEYVVFLGRADRPLSKTLKQGPSPWPLAGTEPLYKILYAGYSVMPVEYTCVLPGCDYGVSVPSAQVHLPASVATIRHDCDPGSHYDTWVRKKDFMQLLSAIRGDVR